MSKSFHKLKTVFLIIWIDDISRRLILWLSLMHHTVSCL